MKHLEQYIYRGLIYSKLNSKNDLCSHHCSVRPAARGAHWPKQFEENQKVYFNFHLKFFKSSMHMPRFL